MSLDFNTILKQLLDAGATAFGAEWKQVETIAPTEFHKLAVQLAAIPANVAKHELDPMQGYSEETGKIILQMQIRALEATLTAVTAITLISVQRAMDAIFDILKGVFADLVPFL
jgi:hypothetical protein